MRGISTPLCFLLLCSFSVSAQGQERSEAVWDSVGVILQSHASRGAGTYRYAFPRRDLTVRVGRVQVQPALALGSWAGFGTMGRDTVVMGDLVVTTSELRPVLQELERQQIRVAAIHNHLVGETPRIMYVHYEATGTPLALARRLDAVLRRTRTPRPVAPTASAAVTVDSALVYSMLGARGHASGAVAQVGFNLVGGPVEGLGGVLPVFAYGTGIGIQAVGRSQVVGTGDFAVPGAKVEPVVRALVSHGILVTALHTHLIGESPAVYFIHFWAEGPIQVELTGIRAALDAAR